MSVLSKPYFHDEAAAFDHLEKVLWNGEAVRPHCGTVGRATKLQGSATRRGVGEKGRRQAARTRPPLH